MHLPATHRRLLLLSIAVLLTVSACGPIPPRELIETEPASEGWEPAFVDDSNADVLVVDSVFGSQAFVVVGIVGAGIQVWRSDDGEAWAGVPPEDVETSGDGLLPSAVTANDSTFVMLGEDQRGPTTSPAVWVSDDGATWRFLDSPAFESASTIVMSDVVWSGRSFIAVGSEPRSELITPDAVVFTSPDGVEWTRVLSDVFRSDAGLRMRTAVATEGAVYAFGSEEPGGTVVLESRDDGRTWLRSSPDALGAAIVENGVGTLGGLLLGGCSDTPGQVPPRQATVWTAPPGLPGALSATQLAESADPSCVLAVDSSERGFVAAGYVGDQPALWQSLDGRAWSEVSLDKPPSLLGGRIQAMAHSRTLQLAVGDGPINEDLLAPTVAVFWGNSAAAR